MFDLSTAGLVLVGGLVMRGDNMGFWPIHVHAKFCEKRRKRKRKEGGKKGGGKERKRREEVHMNQSSN